MSTPNLAGFRAELDSLQREATLYHLGQARRRERRAEDRRLHDWQKANREILEARWLSSTLRRRMLEEHEGAFPSGLAYRDPSQDAIYAIPEAWHSIIYAQHILDMPSGHRFSVSDCYDTLKKNRVLMHKDETRRSTAVIDFMKHLRSRGLLTLNLDEAGDQHFTVECTFKDLPASPESEWAGRGQNRPRCKRCGLGLDLILADYGFHLGCD